MSESAMQHVVERPKSPTLAVTVWSGLYEFIWYMSSRKEERTAYEDIKGAQVTMYDSRSNVMQRAHSLGNVEADLKAQ